MSEQPEPVDAYLSPLEESGFAVERGFIGSAPDVVVSGSAVHRARESVGLTPSDVAGEMTRRGHSTDAATIAALESSSAAQKMRPRQARLLAAILELPLAAIEATAEPSPPDSTILGALGEAGVDAVLFGDDMVVCTAAGNYLGLLWCEGDAEVLDSRTYRLVAATLLNGSWSHLAGVLLVSQTPPHLALPVDALDCVTRSHAPTGLAGFSRLAEPAPIADALASYDRTFSVNWSDPDPLEHAPVMPPSGEALADRLAELADQVSQVARRARQPGKQSGYQAAATWLRNSQPHEIASLLEDLSVIPPGSAYERLSEVLPR